MDVQATISLSSYYYQMMAALLHQSKAARPADLLAENNPTREHHDNNRKIGSTPQYVAQPNSFLLADTEVTNFFDRGNDD